MTLSEKPSDDLNKIYMLANIAWNKSIQKVEKTVECLDFSHIYLNLRHRIEKLNDLVSIIDDFLI